MEHEHVNVDCIYTLHNTMKETIDIETAGAIDLDSLHSVSVNTQCI